MPDLTITDALIARVEGGSGADRELDAEVAVAVGKALRLFEGGQDPGWVAVPSASERDAEVWDLADPYTASLDAVAALAEEMLPGWRWNVTRFENGLWDADAGKDDDSQWVFVAGIATEVRARLAALLRSLQQKDAAE